MSVKWIFSPNDQMWWDGRYTEISQITTKKTHGEGIEGNIKVHDLNEIIALNGGSEQMD